MVQLGDKAKDKVTGVTGIVTSTSQALFGCDRVYIQPGVDKHNKLVQDGFWVDVDSCVVIKKTVVKGHVAKPAHTKTGGPMSRVR